MVRQLNVTRIRLEKEQKNVIPVESEGDDVFISSGVTLPTAVSDSGTGTERTVSNSSPSERVSLLFPFFVVVFYESKRISSNYRHAATSKH